MFFKQLKTKGFTLIELLVVVAIIGVLASVVFSSLNNARIKTRDSSRMATVKQIQNALELYITDNGSYPLMVAPSNLSDLSSFLVPDYINAIDYDMTNVSGATYYRPSSTPNSYLIYVSLERQTQVSPPAYGCRTGMGSTVNSGLYSFAPTC